MSEEHEHMVHEHDEPWVTDEDRALREEVQYLALVIAGTEMHGALQERRVPGVADGALQAVDAMLIIAAGAPEWFMEKVQAFMRGHERCGCPVPLRDHAISMFDSLVEAKKRGAEQLHTDLDRATAALEAYQLAEDMAALAAGKEGG